MINKERVVVCDWQWFLLFSASKLPDVKYISYTAARKESHPEPHFPRFRLKGLYRSSSPPHIMFKRLIFSCMYLHIFSFSQSLPKAYYVPSTSQGTQDTGMNKTDKNPRPHIACIILGRDRQSTIYQ